MVVKKAVLNQWKVASSHGDIRDIIHYSKSKDRPKGLARNTISVALRTGRMHEATFEIINAFYKERIESMLKEESKAVKKLAAFLEDHN